MKTRLLFFLIPILFLYGCGGSKKPSVTSHQVIRDSITTTVRYIQKDTTLYVPADSLSLSVLLSQLKDRIPVEKTEGKRTITIQKIGDTIKADCHNDAYELEIKYQNQIIEIYKSHLAERQSTEVVLEKYIPKAVKVLMWFGIGFLILIIISIIFIIKSFLK